MQLDLSWTLERPGEPVLVRSANFPMVVGHELRFASGNAEALHLADRIGTIAPGYEADLVVLDLASTPAIAQREAEADDIWEAVFPTIMMGDDRAIAATFINGRQTPA